MIKLSNIFEASYRDFKQDPTSSHRQKINTNIAEVNRLLLQVEQLVTHAQKLKTETSSDQTVFYKRTFAKFAGVSDRLNKVSNKLRELSV